VQTIQVTTKILQIPVSLAAFAADTSSVRTQLKTTLATAYGVTANNITFNYFATGTTQPTFQGRRRVLSVNAQLPSTIVEATISTFASIPLPADSAVMASLQTVIGGIALHQSVASLPAKNGFLFDLSLPWFIVFLVLACACLGCFVALLSVCCCANRGASEGEWAADSDVVSAQLMQGHRQHTMPPRSYANGGM